MSRSAKARSRPHRSGLEFLEGRTLPAGGFLSGFGVGVTGPFAAIRSNAVATDPAGDSYITGSFRGTAALDPSSSAGNFTTSNTQDTFVAKYGPTGTLLWARTFAGQATTLPGGGTSYATSQGSALAVDGLGNVFLAGSFSGKVNLVGPSGVTSISTATSTTEAYVAKLNPTGAVTWVDVVAGTTDDDDEAYAIALDGSGGAIFAGSFQDSATFGTTTLASVGTSEAFAARVDGAGNFLWAVATQGTPGSGAEIHGLAVDGSGNVALAGDFTGAVDFDPGPGVTKLTSTGSNDASLWKLNGHGQLLWARSYGSVSYDAATAVAVDASGDVYAAGTFSDSVNFGTVSRPDSITAGPIFDAFVLKVDPTGNEVWAKGLVGPGGWSKGQGIAVDPSGNVDIAGAFLGLVDFDPGPGADNLTSVGSDDVFVEGLSPTGALVYALQAGKINFNAALGIAVNSSGTATITGTYSGSIAFGPASVPSAGIASIFVAQASSPLALPSAPVLEASSDTGPSQSDDITSATSPTFDVNTAGALNTVELLRNGVPVAQRIGPGAITDPGPVAAGTYAYTAIQVLPSGAASLASLGTPVTIITSPPPAPPAPTLPTTDDTGPVGDGITSNRQPRLAVTAPANTTIQLVQASGSVVGSLFTATGGTILVRPSGPLVDGVYAIQARAVDLAGNVGPAGPAFTLTILATPPAAPGVPSILPADDSGGPGLTSVRQPRLTGSAPPNDLVQVLGPTGAIFATATANAAGTYVAKLSAPLADGTYVLEVVAVDVAGNLSPPSPTLTLTIDATPPTAPTAPALLAADDSGALGDGITGVRQPRLTGSAEAGSTVQLLDGSGNLVGSATAAGNGAFTVKPSGTLADGTYGLQARAVDAAGNVGPLGAIFTLTILATPPAAPGVPSILAADDSGGPGLTSVRQPHLVGNASAGSTVELINAAGGATLATATATAAGGSYSARLSAPLADGTYVLEVVAVDVAGNLSPPSPTLTLTIDATPPTAPTAPTLLAADDSGAVGDGITSVRQPRLTATAGAGLVVKLENASSVVLATASASSSGAVTISPSTALVDGTYVLHLVAVDSAGNVSASSGAISLVILGTPPPTPAAPSLLAVDDTGVSGDGVTSVTRPRLVGTAAPGGRVDWIAANGSILATTTASTSNGTYQLQPPSALVNGTYPVQVRETDPAGNVSVASVPFNLTILVASGDYLADSKSDVGVFQTSSPDYFEFLRNGLYVIPYGAPGDVPVHGDFWGDGHDDLAFYRPSTSTFYAYDLATSASLVVPLGQRGDIPVPADYDGDGRTDFAVFRPSNGTWYVDMSATNTVFAQVFAYPGDIPVPADYLGNGHADFAVYHQATSTFYAYDPISGGFRLVPLGVAGDLPVPGDYEGLGHADFAVFQPNNLTWSILMSASNTVAARGWGIPGDTPVLGDYFGDGRNDLVVYRASTSTFFELDPATGAVLVNQVGTPGLVRPLQGPITTWFSFGGSGATNAIRGTRAVPAVTPAGATVDAIPDPTDPSSPGSPDLAKAKKVAAVDRVIDGLGLESWRGRS